MKNLIRNCQQRKAILLALTLPLMFSSAPMQARQRAESVKEVTQQSLKIINARKINPTTIEVLLSDNQRMTFDFYGENIFRLFQDNSGGILRDPEAKPEAHILVNNPIKNISKLNLNDNSDFVSITTGKINLLINKNATHLSGILV